MTGSFSVAARTLRRSPAFTLTALASIGVGIGACTSIFAVVSAVFFQAPPYAEPDRLVQLMATQTPASTQPADYVAPERMLPWVRDDFRTLESLAGYAETGFRVQLDGEPSRVAGTIVTGEYFRALGVSPSSGRYLTPNDDRGGAPLVAVVSGPFADGWFPDRSPLGATLRLTDAVYEVVGVMPSTLEPRPRVWVPQASLAEDQQPRAWRGVARLSGAAAVDVAVQEVQLKAAAEVAQDSAAFGGFGATVIPFGQLARASDARALQIAAGVVGALFVIMLANLTNLFLARASARGGAVALRAALGGSPWQIGQLLVWEALLLCTAGGVLGLLLSAWGSEVIRVFVGVYTPISGVAGLDARVFAFAVLLSIVCAGALALEPLRHLRVLDLRGLLQKSSTLATLTKRQRRVRDALLSLQVGFSVVLIAVTAMLVVQFEHFMDFDIGFDSDRVVMAAVRFGPSETGAEQWRLAQTVADRVAPIPGTVATTVWSSGFQNFPPQPEAMTVVEGREIHPRQQIYAYYRVSPSFFETLQVPIVRGRRFTAADDASQPLVGIVPATTADRLWPGEDPLGKRLKLGTMAPWITVVGVSEDFAELRDIGRYWAVAGVRRSLVLLPGAQLPEPPPGWRDDNCVTCDGAVAAGRVADDPQPLIMALRREFAALRPDLEMRHAGPIRDLEVASFSGRQLRTNRLLIGAAALAGLLLSLLGVMGIVADGVVRRTREIGIRQALGANALHLVRTVASEGVVAALAGIGIGVVLAFAAEGFVGEAMRSIGVRDPIADPLDPRVLAVTAGIIVLATGVTAVLVARRATRLTPTEALAVE